ncbi:TonB-dependent siderophore receptor [Pseudomonas sp. FME51]|uniref:TonB-dependent siderophore receptor n=1 Tax=Pseudomonas sp. FME51 TaxID=2742609 RepID=UPI0018672ED0|nr:TonB-dependent siderophore receptor [Pseudomonas sp. FME51]
MPHAPRRARRPLPVSLRLGVVLGYLIALPAVAQSSAVDLPDDIIFGSETESATGPVEGYTATRSATATKTDTALTETPRSISVVTAERMRDQGVQTVQDALRYVSGVRGEAYGLDARGDSALIRGSSPAAFLDGLQQSFGSYTNTRPDPFALERVEVLKGPASMLYGQSPVGGLVNLVSKRPQSRQQTELQLQYGTHDRKQIAIDSTGPLTDDGNWLYRVVAIARDSGTQVDHVDDDRLVLMPSITWQPTDNLEWTLLANIQRDDSGSTSQFLPHRGTLLSAPYGRFDTNLFVSEPGFDEYDTEQLALTSLLTWRLNETWILRQNLRYQESEVSYQQIYGWPPVLAADDRTLNRIYHVSKPEVDVWAADQNAQALFDTGPFQHTLLIGADYQHAVTNRDQAGGAATPLDLYNPVYGTFDPSIISLTADPEQTVAQRGLYLQDQIRYQRWLLTLGLRKDWADNRTEGGTRQKDDATTGHIGLTYLLDNGLAPYLSYSESFQPVIGLNAADNQPYKPMEGEQWELGIKYQPPGSASLYTAALFDLREQNRRMPDPANPLNTIQTGETRSRGLELEALASVTPRWDLIATYTYLDTEIVKGSAVEQGHRLASTPEHMASLWSQHRFALFGLPGFSAGAGVRYVGASWDGTDSLKTPSTTLFDAMLSYSRDNWTAALNATNLEDETYYTTCLARGDCFIGSRRTLVGSLSYTF